MQRLNTLLFLIMVALTAWNYTHPVTRELVVIRTQPHYTDRKDGPFIQQRGWD
jgi:hypothetical protein